ncbi:MAG: Gfo/Idh/MocA family oxidoreductase [Gemmataceae bacterium]
MPALRVAIVGAGLMGQWHARYADRSGGTVTAIIDPDPAAAAELRQRFPAATVFRHVADGLAANNFDIAHVCTPLASHAALAAELLCARRHVLAEKPLTPSTAEARDLLSHAAGHGVRLNPVHQFRFQDGFRRVCHDLGRFGELTRVTFRTCTAGGDGRSAADRRCVLQEIAPHPLSLVRALRGAGASRLNWEVREFTADELSFAAFDRGTSYEALISLRGRPIRNDLILLGTRASALVDLFHGYAVVESGLGGRLAKATRPFRFGTGLLAAASLNLLKRVARREPAYPGLRTLIREFYRAVRDRGPVPVADEEIIEVADFVERLGRHPGLIA